MNARLLAVAVVAIGLTGCLKMKQNFLVMPDGSGKMTLTMGFKAQGPMGDMTSDMGDPQEMTDNMKGIVALAKPKVVDKEGWKYMTVTAYYDDINEVKILDQNTGKVQQEFSFKKEGDGHVFEAKGSMLGEMGGAGAMPGGAPPGGAEGEMPEEMKKMMEDMMKKMLEGMEINLSASLPGKVTSIEGYTAKDGRKASLAISGDDLKKPEDNKKIQEKTKKLRAVCGPADISKADQEAFKKELENAKAEWEKMKAEMKEKKKEDEGEGADPMK